MLLHKGKNFDIRDKYPVTYVGYKVELINNNNGISICKYYAHKTNKNRFFKSVSYKTNEFASWEQSFFKLTKEEFQKEFSQIPIENTIF